MDSYPPDKKALREGWIVGCLTIRWITSILTGKNRIFLKFPTSTSAAARYLSEEVGQAGRKASWVPVPNCARDFIDSMAVVE